MQLSKSDYMMYLHYPPSLWLKKFDKKMLPPDDENKMRIFAQGYLFEDYAEQLFDGGVTVGWSPEENNYGTMPARTKTALESGAKTVFQARFEAGNITCICDVIQIDENRVIDLCEIKASGSVKQDHISDLAFQTHVLQSCGFRVNSVSVAYVNTKYVRKGDINIREFCLIEDVTNEVKMLIEPTAETIEEIFLYLDRNKRPQLAPPENGGDLYRWIEIYTYNNPQQPGSIFDLCFPKNRVAELFTQGIKTIDAIPDGIKLSPKQKLQVAATKQDLETCDDYEIKRFLDRLRFPLYFLDYETLSSVLPLFDGISPYSQLPFQYSLHVLREPGSELEHCKYLHRDNTDPTTLLSEHLQQHIGDEGTILTWNMSFEKGCNTLMGKVVPQFKTFYHELNERIDDLCIPFQKNWYVHKDFLGSYSIKKVLPVLAPELSYKDLDINEGGSAQRLWMESVLEGKRLNEKEKILEDLDKYCELDTLAMVKIYDWLIAKTAGQISASHVESTEKSDNEKLTLF